MNGIIIKAISGFYYVENGNTVYECKARGSFRHGGISPKVGDAVEFTADGKKGIIEKIFQRKSDLLRPAVANIEKLFIVSSFVTPSPSTLIIDRLTAQALFNSIKPVIVFNKSDLGDFSELASVYKSSGFNTIVASAKTGEGLAEIIEEIKDCVCAFSGNSGVGKSSLINALFPSLNLQTGEVSQKLGRGRHTTRETQLFAHEYNGYVADTPGFSTFENNGDVLEFKEHLVECFPDIEKHSYSCKFVGCSHTSEKGCSVLESVNSGKICISRHQSYVTIYDELKDLKKWNIK